MAKIKLQNLKSNKRKGGNNTYTQQKQNVRSKAIEWHYDFCNHSYSYEELAVFACYFNKLAKRFGLIKEFKENGII